MSVIACIRSSIVVLALFAAACDSAAPKPDRGGKDPSRTPQPVMVVTARFEDSGRIRTFAATIRPSIESDLGFRISGKVARRLVRTGDFVHSGQALLTLDTNDLRLQREQAEAEVKAAQSSLVQAEADEARATALQSKGWTTKATLQKAGATAEEARSRLVRAQRALDLATHSLDYATLEADADGVITATPVEPGQVISAGQAAVRLARRSELEAVVALPESYVEPVQRATASLSLWSLPGKTYDARLRELSFAADPATRTFAARFVIPSADDKIRIGMSATLTLREQAGRHFARLPLTAVFNHGRGASVLIVGDGGRLSERLVTIERYEDRSALVTSGVMDGESVVALGVENLDPRLTVRPVSSLSLSSADK
ncbi:efflux RND transporter periplasmic adaptor subunit [Rhodopseudomonas sp. NSM]|uniref:efflux RND transporter periplasmic adaptor subunit n=1 Tax=Rhodopseudomonas sp. NSM TaxID=3457630 RepID=UPI0040373865